MLTFTTDTPVLAFIRGEADRWSKRIDELMDAIGRLPEKDKEIADKLMESCVLAKDFLSRGNIEMARDIMKSTLKEVLMANADVG